MTLLRLRIGHTSLNSHLHRLGLEPSPNCEWCDREDTITHLFNECFRHYSIRTDLQSSLRSLRVAFTLENLLGGGTEEADKKFVILRQVKIFLKKSGRIGRI